VHPFNPIAQALAAFPKYQFLAERPDTGIAAMAPVTAGTSTAASTRTGKPPFTMS
jgi:1,4-dihydroxy-2-naphthoate octaprenyltransferase